MTKKLTDSEIHSDLQRSNPKNSPLRPTGNPPNRLVSPKLCELCGLRPGVLVRPTPPDSNPRSICLPCNDALKT